MPPRKRRANSCALEALEIVEDSCGSGRWAVAQLAANETIEDAFAADEDASRSSPAGPSHVWAVFDGHGGTSVASFLKKNLLGIVRKHLDSPEGIKSPEAALSAAFLEADSLYLEEHVHRKIKELVEKSAGTPPGPAILDVIGVGSCGLLALLRGDKLYVANAGDSRAVLGRRDPHDRSKYTCEVLSNDHNTRSREEIAAVIKRSGDAGAVLSTVTNEPVMPDEASIAEEGTLRVRGTLLVTRAFGDAYLKAGLAELVPEALRRSVPERSYISAEPEVRCATVRPGDFFVLASDGLYEELSNDEVVRIVADCVPWAPPPPRSAGRERERPGEEAAGRRHGAAAAAARLVEKCIETAADGIGLSLSMVGQLPPGPARRMIHDDVTAAVVFCSPFLPGNHEEGGSPRAYPMPLAESAPAPPSGPQLQQAPTPLLGAAAALHRPIGGTSPRAFTGRAASLPKRARGDGGSEEGPGPGPAEGSSPSDGGAAEAPSGGGASRRKGAPKRRDF
eukprot:tig00000741_g3843.t1